MRKVILTALVATGLVLGASCGKKEESTTEAAADASAETPAADAATTATPAPAPAAPAGAETLPGANRVREALASKDYETAVGGLLALRGAATGERSQEYAALYGEVIDTLRAEMGTDRKAAQAYASLMATRSAR